MTDGRDGTAPDPLVWSAGALPKRRRLVHAVRDRAFLPGPPGIWLSDWFQIPATAICAEDIAFSPGLLVKWVSFLGSLHWPVGDLDLGLVAFLVWNCSFSMSFGLVRGCRLKGPSSLSSTRASNFSVGCSFWSRH